jgi:hypothetical protein
VNVLLHVKRVFPGIVFFLLVSASAAEAGLSLLPTLSVSEEYTDNFYGSDTLLEEEFTSLVSPGVAIAYKTPLLVLAGTYIGGVEFYLRHDEGNRYRQAFVLDVGLPFLAHRFRGVDMRITEEADYAPDLPSIPLGDKARTRFGPTIGRLETFRNRAGFLIDYRGFSKGTSHLSYTNTDTRYTLDTLEDFVVHDFKFTQALRIAPRSGIAFAYGIAKTDFEKAPDFYAKHLSMGTERPLDHGWALHGTAGASWIEISTIYTVMTLGTSKTVGLSLFGIDYERRIGAGEDVLPAPTLHNIISVKATHPVTSKSVVEFSLDQAERSLLSNANRKANTFRATAGIATRLSNRLEGSIRYAHLDYEGLGLLALPNVRRNMVIFMLSLVPPEALIE